MIQLIYMFFFNPNDFCLTLSFAKMPITRNNFTGKKNIRFQRFEFV